MASAYFNLLWDNLWIALALFIFIWVFQWAKGNLGSAKLAILFAIMIVYLTIYQFPELVWAGVALFFFSTFGKDFLGKIDLKQYRP
jgi:hypothetical protein